jgi:hypothetical protein
MIDYLSKCPEEFPLYKKETKEIAEKLSEAIYRLLKFSTSPLACGW